MIVQARRRLAVPRTAAAPAPPVLPLPWGQRHVRMSTKATTTKTKTGTKRAMETKMRLGQRRQQDDDENNDDDDYNDNGAGIRDG